MKVSSCLFLTTLMTVVVTGCQTTSTEKRAPSHAVKSESAITQDIKGLSNNNTLESTSQSSSLKQNGETVIRLEKIMSDPSWMGRFPVSMNWSVDGKALVYELNEEGSVNRETYIAPLTAPTATQKAPLSQLHKYRFKERVERNDGVVAFLYGDSAYVQFTDGELVQLTRGGSRLSMLSFMTDGRLMALNGNRFIAINLENGQREELLQWVFGEKPSPVKPAKDYIAKEQQTLIEYIKKQRHNKTEKAAQKRQIAEYNNSIAPVPFYFDAAHTLAGVSVSPNGRYAIIATKEKRATRDKSDIMPHYIQEDGRIASQSVRQRVVDAKPVNHQLWLIDLTAGEKRELTYFNLPGFNEDVLADVKRENAEAKGERYEINRLPRDIRLMSATRWNKPTIRWNTSGEKVAVMLEAWDNKDRWIATVNFKNGELVNQHRLHNDAWINYRHNAFGWLHHSDVLYYQSEETGYAHLYIKALNESPVALTAGSFVASHPTLTKDDKYVYYKANVKHPGMYEIYRVNVETLQSEALTNLGGMTDYKLSPDEQTLLLTHSKIQRPPELYVKQIGQDSAAQQVTFGTTDAYNAMPWIEPRIIEIPSSHTEAPIYARLYLPKNSDSSTPNKAVVFNHGSGYLQNAHYGWSLYFREFMFNSMLAQQGYVVLDMDYRASAGYGSAWRTAIYRHMGKPELEDLRDGVNWLANHANVDTSRIGTYGGSYGGFLTFMAMFKEPDLFAAGAALRPVTDWAHYNTGYTSNILNTPQIDPIAYKRSSPIYFADGLQKPLLINAPMVDNNVFFHDTVRLVQRLIELEKENFETAIYPVEPHGFVQPSSWLDEYRRIYKLFETHL